jgi:hypothetical protein
MTIKTACGIATLKSREQSFRQTIESIYPQVDVIYAVLNNYEKLPNWITRLKKIRPVLGHNNLGDAGKFLFVDICENCFYLSCDDDLWYPHGYAYMMKRRVEKYNSIVTLHGKRYNKIGTKDYRKDYIMLMQCLGSTAYDFMLHIGGTGVMAFHTKDFKLSIADFERPNMADLFVAKRAFEQGVPIMGIAHHKKYLTYIPPEDTPIWNQELDTEYQTRVINEFLLKR